MQIADSYVGHRDDPKVTDRLADADPHRVVLSDTDRRRSRIRTETTDGRDLGVVVARDLGDGDVLETEDGDLVVVELAAVEVLVVPLADGVSATAALELGHAVGNRHWDLVVRDGEALIPVTDSRERMEDTVDEHLSDVDVRYETVPPTTFDDGGSAHGGHSGGHSHGDDTHSHDHGVRTLDGGGS